MSRETHGDLAHGRCQEIGDAAAFLGFDGLLATSARWPCRNLVIFTDSFGPDELTIAECEPLDWNGWRAARRAARKR